MSHIHASKRLALVVEDEESNRRILASLLKKQGYQVVEAGNGAEAVERFQAYAPEIIFMDVLMPVMDGYEATSRIRSLAGDRFVPIIFLTAMSDERALARCIEVGGDDFLAKPFKFTLLSAKVKALERIRALQQATRSLYNRLQRDEEIAEQLFSGAVAAGNVALQQIHHLLKPADVFSGDLLLTAFAPSRDLHLLLGDFTGHGLAATLGALPTSEVFRSMTAKGFSPQQILYAINNKLHDLLPTGMFLAAHFVQVDARLDHIMVINCGMPECFVIGREGGGIKQRIASRTLPLGINRDTSFKDQIHYVAIAEGDRLILASDGVTEARNPAGEYFGKQRLIDAITQCQECDYVIDRLSANLDRFCGEAPQDDDISAVEVPLIPALLPVRDQTPPPLAAGSDRPEALLMRGQDDSIEFHLTLHGRQLRLADPVPILINYIQETAGLFEHRRPLFSILTELYVNALDHGILRLDSFTKQGEDGFTNYFQEREQRLHSLSEGRIRIGLRIHHLDGGGYIVIAVEDSGRGFDYNAVLQRQDAGQLFSGRGILLVQSLCEHLSYRPPGNKVEAIYVWEEKEA